jgi:hypothetical protein
MANFQKDGLWVQGGGGNLAAVSEDTPYVPGQLGKVQSIRRDSGGKQPQFFQYVQRYTTETAAFAAGKPVYWQDLDDFVVTADSATALGTSDNPVVAGFALGTSPAAGKFGFIQVGSIAAVAVTGTVVVGDRLNLGSNVQLVPAAAISITSEATSVALPGTVLGVALEAVGTSTDSTILAQLTLFRNGW